MIAGLFAGLGFFADALAVKTAGVRTTGGGVEFGVLIPLLAVVVGVWTLLTRRVWTPWAWFAIASGVAGLVFCAVLPLSVLVVER